MTTTKYKKRPGTSGIRGQLYETKLISLINFRAKHNVNIKEFALATNMDNIGIFDDICLRFKVKTLDKPLAVFIQAKHRENDTLLKNDWATYFESYLKIKQSFKATNKDLIFKGQYDEIECFFVIYTTARGDSNYKTFESSLASSLNDVVGTAQGGQQIVVTNKDVECLYKVIMKEQVTQLAKPIAKLFFDEINDFQMFMYDKFVYRYHVILAQSFFNVSDIQTEGYRLAHVRKEFFETEDEILVTFKSSLYKEVTEKRKVNDSELQTLLALFFDKPTDVTILSKVIGCVITYKNGKLEFVNNKMINDDLKRQLSKVHVPDVILEHAIETAGRDILSSKQNLKVPVAFGNKDLTVSRDKRLTYLAEKIFVLIAQSNHNNVITIDESVDNRFLGLNGGIASAVGNLLVFDENSKMLKFNENFQELGDVAKRMLAKLKENKAINLNKYRIDVKIKKFPKLTFECGDHDKNMVKDFINRLLFYTNQADENGTGEILRKEIEKYQSEHVNKNSFLSHLIFLKYHDGIQNWWMLPNEVSYLTEESKIYEKAMKTVVSEPSLTVMNKMYEIKTEEANLAFNYNVMNSLELIDQPGYVVITESVMLTLYKVKQYLQRKDHVVVDIKYSSELQPSEHETLLTELENTNKDKIIIIVFNNILTIDEVTFKRFMTIAQKIKNKLTIIITDSKLFKMVQNIFPDGFSIVYDDKTNLRDLSEDTQHSILQKKILFQGQEIKFRSIVDDISKSFVKGDVLSKIIHNETILLGKAIDMSNYDKVKNTYIGRRVCRNKKRYLPVMRIQTEDDTLIRLKHLQFITCSTQMKEINTKLCKNKFNEQQHESFHVDTLHDIDDDVVILTTKPGMGKSAFFTHLFLQTKKVDQTMWIVRINLLEHCRQFSKWQQNRTVIDILECLKFICLAILGNTERDVTFELQELNNELSLDHCTGDELFIFELKMLLHSYNRKKLIFLFDGFDEICPHYSNEVLALLKILESYPKYIKHKIWITSRPYEKVKTILEEEFDVSYDLENFSWTEQNMFLYMSWIKNEIILNNNETHLENIYDFIDFMSQNTDINLFFNENDPSNLKEIPLLSVYINFICYLKVELKSAPPRIMTALNVLYDRCFAYIPSISYIFTDPLNLNIIANYFLNEIKVYRSSSQKWNLHTSSFTFYEYFVETKLRWNFHEKYGMDLRTLDHIVLYDCERRKMLKCHKKLGAYATFYEHRDIIFAEYELSVLLVDYIERLKHQGDRTGIICNVDNDIPTFIHQMFANYFAVEYISDLLKSRKHKQKMIFEFLSNVLDVKPSLKLMFENKLKVDSELKAIVDRNRRRLVCCNIFHIDLYVVFVLFLFCIIDVLVSHIVLFL